MNVHYTFSRSLSLRYIYIYTSHIIFVTSCWKGERSSMTIRRKSYKLGLFPIFSSQLDLLLEVLPVNWALRLGVALFIPARDASHVTGFADCDWSVPLFPGIRSNPLDKLTHWQCAIMPTRTTILFRLSETVGSANSWDIIVIFQHHSPFYCF